MNSLTDSAATALRLILALDAGLLAIVGRSLLVSATACALACSAGLVLGAGLGVARFAMRPVLLTLLNTMLAVPSVVIGLVVYLLLSRSGPLGFLGWLFSFKAMVIAQACLVLPVVTALTRQAVEDVERAHGEQLRSLGAGPLLRSLLLACMEQMDVTCFRLSVRKSNIAALRLYAQQGFRIVDTWSKYYNGGEDALVLEKCR